MGGTSEGERWVTNDSSSRGSRIWPDLRRKSNDMGFLSRDLVLTGAAAAAGDEAALELPDSFSVRPLMSEVWDLEWLTWPGDVREGVNCVDV